MIINETNIHEFLGKDGRLEIERKVSYVVISEEVGEKIKSIYCGGKKLEHLTIPTTCTELELIDVDGSDEITSLTIPDSCTSLKFIYCKNNQYLSKLILPKECPFLEIIDVHNNGLSTLIIPNAPRLTNIYCKNNKLSSLIIPKSCTSLEYFTCEDNNLTDFTLPKECTNLRSINLLNNKLVNFVVHPSFSSPLLYADDDSIVLVFTEVNIYLNVGGAFYPNRYKHHKKRTDAIIKALQSSDFQKLSS